MEIENLGPTNMMELGFLDMVLSKIKILHKLLNAMFGLWQHLEKNELALMVKFQYRHYMILHHLLIGQIKLIWVGV